MPTRNVAACAALGLFAILFVSCATTSNQASGSAGPARTAEQVANARFRATWWNHYDRAVAWQVLGNWDKAEADLRSAIGKRSRDQRWARTYGLHFKPEYFPKRELGFVLYKQERYEDALQLLEQSMAEQPTARAAYYVDECRALLVSESGTDSGPPKITLLSPDVNESVASLLLAGQVSVSDDTFVRRVWVDGEPARTITVSTPGTTTIDFAKPATPGSNSVSIRAEDIVGNVTEVAFQFDTDLDGPAVSFDEPIRVPGTVSGIVSDSNGVSVLRIAGRPVTLHPIDATSYSFSAEVSQTDLARSATYRAEDSRGNATEDVLVFNSQLRARGGEVLQIASNAPIPAGLLDWPEKFAAAEGTPEILFSNLEDGREFSTDQILVKVVVAADAPVAQIALDGQPFQGIVPNRANQRVTRRVALKEGENVIAVSAVDDQGRESRGAVTVVRTPQPHETVDAKLGIVHLGAYAADLSSPTAVSSSEFNGEFDRILEERFDQRFSKVDRANIDAILDEQLLSAVASSSEEKLALSRVTPADVMLVTEVKVMDNHLEAVMQVIDTETAVYSIVDAYGPYSESTAADDAARVATDLAFHLAQRFPRVQAPVLAAVHPGQVYLSQLNTVQGVQPGMKCLLARAVVTPIEGQDPYIYYETIGTARTEDVRAENARIRLTEPISTEGILPNELVAITK